MMKRYGYLFVFIAVLIASTLLFAQERGRRGFTPQSDAVGQIQTNTLGDIAADLLYTPLSQPCRIVDTRVTGGALAAGETRNFFAYEGSGTDISGQGGKSGGCGVPADAAAVHMNFVSVSPTGTGNLKGAAYNLPIPTTGSIINYAAVSGLNLANAVNMPVCMNGCTADFTVQANGAGTHLVVDVLGYFRKHKTAFVHTVPATGTFSLIDNPVTNGNPQAIILITHNWGSSLSGTNNADTHLTGVIYYATFSKWAIYHEDGTNLTANEMFNVLVLNP